VETWISPEFDSGGPETGGEKETGERRKSLFNSWLSTFFCSGGAVLERYC
jgi:hypothetical protein